ncbi:exonuclease [Atlantibacter hermannii]|uniref:exonuclease n=1 Tax=Atlantibacter hermannii TaxID=565 RepID=UPI0028B05149|nr:3'-5' exoribonuclease [Atlantibacter hermannii]
MATYAYLIKAKAKAAEAKNLFCWFDAKSDSRAEREILNILDDADIEVGRGADYQLPVRTNWFVVDDLPPEGMLDDTWCDRYELGEDGKSWTKISSEAGSVNVPNEHAQLADSTDNTNAEVANTPALLRPVARLRLPQRLIAHLLNDTEEKEISETQHVQIGAIEADEKNLYAQNLLQACRDALGVDELSAHVEWKLVQSVKQLFPMDQNHEVSAISAFIDAWVKAEPGERQQLVKDWADTALGRPDTDNPVTTATAIVQKLPNADMPELITVATLPFRQRLLAQFISESEYAYHIHAEQKNSIIALEMDVDNSYVQNLLLAAENTPSLKDVREYDLWKLTSALKEAFPQDKKLPELGVMLQFLKAWSETAYIDKGLLVKEWAKGNRISSIQRTDTGTNAGGGIATDRNSDYEHTLDTLDIEIAAATLPMDFDIYNIPGAIHRRAKEIVQKKESPFREWSAALRKTAGVLDYSRAVIFAMIRSAHPEFYKYPGRLTGYINAYLTESNHEKPTEEVLAAARQIDSAAVVAGVIRGDIPADNLETLSTEFAVVGKLAAEATSKSATETSNQPKIESIGAGVFSIEGLVSSQEKDNPVINIPSNKVEKTENATETTSDVQMEATVSIEEQNDPQVSASQATDADDVEPDPSADSVTDYAAISTGKLFTHLMVDLETMGSNPDAPIVSIGAVFFEPSTGETGPEFYQVVDLTSAMNFGAKPDASTILWWMKQSSEARSALLVEDAADLDVALTLFSEFLCGNAANGAKSVQVWGNGASFDNVLLKQSYELVGGAAPWRFVNDRDVRTIVELGNAVGINPRYDIPFEGDKHNALADALHQAKYVSAIWQRLTAN